MGFSDERKNLRWPSVFEITPRDARPDAGIGMAGMTARRSWLPLLFIGLASMVAQGFGRFTFPVLLTAIDSELLGSYTLAGFLSNVPLVAYLIGTGFTSVLSTRTDPSDLMKIGVALSALGLGSMSVSPNAWTLAVALFLAGFGAALVWVPAPGIAASMVGPTQGGLAIGLVGSGIGTGVMLAGPLTTAVRATTGNDDAWRPVYGLQAVFGVCVFVGLLLVLRRGQDLGESEKVPVSVLTTVPKWRAITLAFVVFGVTYSLFFYFLPAQLVASGWSGGTARLMFALLGLASIFGGVVFGRLSDHFSRRTTMGFGFVVMAAAPLLTLADNGVVVVVGVFAFGLCIAGVPTTIGAMLADSLDGRSFVTAFGTVTFAFGIAQLFGPPFAGWVGERTGSFQIPFIVASGVALLGALLSVQMKTPRDASNL
ncbi:MAG: MFS transporter [Actinomycetota bacterium]|nr:MFS transporter [Actinomycetota bacterium]